MRSLISGFVQTGRLALNKLVLCLTCSLVVALVLTVIDALCNGAVMQGMGMLFGDIGLTAQALPLELGAALGFLFGLFRDPMTFYIPVAGSTEQDQ